MYGMVSSQESYDVINDDPLPATLQESPKETLTVVISATKSPSRSPRVKKVFIYLCL